MGLQSRKTVNVQTALVSGAPATQTTVVTGTPASAPADTCKVFILAWAQANTGNPTTTIIEKINQMVGAQRVNVFAGATEAFLGAIQTKSMECMGVATITNGDLLSFEYTLTAGAGGGGVNCLQSGILVFTF